MSLNGLDTPQVQQAYSAAISEAGGWFLLKYISRDEVDLLDSGKAGVGEARAAIAQYQDLSPLYGLLVYRRRKVLVKYVPEGTSRLLQARTTVHLQDVQDKYSPYETMLEVTTADGVSDTALAAAFPLHTASPALSSNNQLNEITEDIEDGEHAPSISSLSSRRPGPDKRPSSQRSYRSPSFPSVPFAADHSPVLKQRSSLSQFLVREELGHKSVTPLNEYPPSEDTASTKDDTASITSTRTDTVTSSASSRRPSNNEYTGEQDLEKYLDQFFKPKIKLGPRPVNVSDKGKRGTSVLPPNTRPVSSLPANFRSAHKPLSMASRSPLPESYTSFSSGPPRLPSLHFSPQIPDIPDFLPPRSGSRGSSRSLPAARASKQLLSPEKQRLMKALEIRNKQMRNSTPPEAIRAVPSVQSLTDVPEIPSPTTTEFHQSQLRDLRHETIVHKADSGIDIDEPPFHSDKTSSSPVSRNLPFTMASHLRPSDTYTQSISSDRQHPEDIDKDLSKKTSMPESKNSTFNDCSALGITGIDLSTSNEPSSHPKAPEPLQNNGQLDTEDYATQPEVTDMAVEKQPEETISDTPVEATISDTPVEAPSSKPFEDTISSDAVDDTILGAQKEDPISDKPVEEAILHEQDDNVTPVYTSLQNDIEPEQNDESDVQKKRRRGLIEPLHIDVNTDARDSEQFHPDEDFMEELHSATVEQATPIAMSRSPASPFFPPRRPSARSIKSSRSITSAMSGDTIPSVPSVPPMANVVPDLLLPASEVEASTASRSPSVSSARTPDSERGDPIPLVRKATNVSSGISRRIQALAELSAREGSPPLLPGSRQLSADHLSTVAQRKSSLIDSADARATLAGAVEKKPAARVYRWPAPATNPSNMSDMKVRQPQKNPDSVSVTARIVRVPRAGQENQTPQLQASPLLINHTRPTQNDNYPPMAPLITDGHVSKSPDAENGTLPPGSRDGVTSPTTRYSIDSGATSTNRKSFDRKSFSRLRSPESPKKLKHSATVPLSESPDRASRTSRFFKRISHLGGNTKRKSVPQVPTLSALLIPELAPPVLASPTAPVHEPASAPEPVRGRASASTVSLAPSSTVSVAPAATPAPKAPRPDSVADVPPPVSVGDLNVQFPDTLLWKRRLVEIDSTGNIMFTAARHSTHNKAFNSKFHLKELGAPYIPDIDSQEMPHSVLFDLVEGEGSLQFASEDSMSQRQLLTLLTTYHQAWMTI